VAYSQKCTHLSCAVYYQPEHGRIYCPCHEGIFDPQTGEPIAGPPQRRLPQIELRQEGGQLIAVREVP
jgi:arsenite oxidase small subunit